MGRNAAYAASAQRDGDAAQQNAIDLTLLADARALSKGRARFKYAVDIVREPPGSAILSSSAVRASSCGWEDLFQLTCVGRNLHVS